MKDSKGHGSNARGRRRPIPRSPFHAKTDNELRNIAVNAANAASGAIRMGDDERVVSKHFDQVSDAMKVIRYRSRGGKSDAPGDQRAGVGIHAAQIDALPKR